MGGLPRMPYSDGIKKHKTIKFGGYMHTMAASEGDVYDMTNMSSRAYPSLCSRAERHNIKTLSKPNGIHSWDGLCYADGTGFYYGGELKGTVEDSEKYFASLGVFIIIMPDKKYYNTYKDEFGDIELKYTAGAGTIKFANGVLYDEEAAANSLTTTGEPFEFNVGDAVTIEGCEKLPNNNKTPIIREISEDKKTLRFYEYTFDVGTETAAITITRAMPDMDYICVNENRVWGCKGDTVYASKLGDIFNYNVFDGTASDAYATNVGSDGDFTGCISFLGYPVFFKENHIYKVYGTKPSDYQVLGAARGGVKRGCGRSLAVAGETLYYLGNSGVMMYTGALPRPIKDPFGEEVYSDGVAGSDGLKYYISMKDSGGEYHLFVFDTQKAMWHREDNTHAIGFANDGGLYCLRDNGRIQLLSGDVPEGAQIEGAVEWSAEFAEFYFDDPNQKGVSKLQIRAEAEAGATLKVEIRYNSEEWKQVAERTVDKIQSFYLPVIPARCDHLTLRLSGTGTVRIQSLVIEAYSGSELY